MLLHFIILLLIIIILLFCYYNKKIKLKKQLLTPLILRKAIKLKKIYLLCKIYIFNIFVFIRVNIFLLNKFWCIPQYYFAFFILIYTIF